MAGQFVKKRQNRAGSPVFSLITLLLLLAALVLGLNRAYHLRLVVDTERISPTITGADVRAELDLVSQLRALSMDEDVALPEFFRTDSTLSSRLRSAAEMTGTVQQILDYLGSYDERLGADRSLIDSTWLLLDFVQAARFALALAGFLLLALLGLFVWKLLCGRYLPAAVLGGLSALLLGLLPLGLLWAVKAFSAELTTLLGAAARYGIGFSARLSLTALGKAQVLFCAAALLTTACALLLLPRSRRRRASQLQLQQAERR